LHPALDVRVHAEQVQRPNHRGGGCLDASDPHRGDLPVDLGLAQRPSVFVSVCQQHRQHVTVV
jgi:hypothetical protein